VTAPELRAMTDAEADYLLGAAMGLAQAARLIPVAELRRHLQARARETGLRGDGPEAAIARREEMFADTLVGLVADAERLMDARRAAVHVERQALDVQQQADAMSDAARANLPPSRRPLGDDDVWTAPPARPR